MTYEEKNKLIKELATDVFMDSLVMIAKLQGWEHDYVEVKEFVETVVQIKTGIKTEIGEPYTVEN